MPPQPVCVAQGQIWGFGYTRRASTLPTKLHPQPLNAILNAFVEGGRKGRRKGLTRAKGEGPTPPRQEV